MSNQCPYIFEIGNKMAFLIVCLTHALRLSQNVGATQYIKKESRTWMREAPSNGDFPTADTGYEVLQSRGWVQHSRVAEALSDQRALGDVAHGDRTPIACLGIDQSQLRIPCAEMLRCTTMNQDWII